MRYVSVADSGPWTCSAATVTAAFGTTPANRMPAVMLANVSDTAGPRRAGIRRRHPGRRSSRTRPRQATDTSTRPERARPAGTAGTP